MNGRMLALALTAGAGWGCVYYNGLWSAHRYATEARRQERDGRGVSAIQSWSVSAVEAESVVVHHPHSSWLSDALVTAAEGLTGGGDCASAAPYVDRASALPVDRALEERLTLVRAECALRGGGSETAESLATTLFASKDQERRNRAVLLGGRAARAARRPGHAAAVLARSPERAAGVEQALALIEAGAFGQADTLCDALVPRRLLESDWDSIFVAMAGAAGPASASRTVGRVVPRARLTAGQRARLYLDDGSRLLEAGDARAADVRFAQAQLAAPDSVENDIAKVARIRARIALLTNLDSLSALTAAVAHLAEGGGGASDARHLQAVLGQLGADDSGVATTFRNGELARDSLSADPLAVAVLLRFARRNPGSLFAPKAILAAIPLAPDRSDSLARVLDANYPASPYTLALRGAPSPGYAAAEDSLARLFGIRTFAAVAQGAPSIESLVAPLTGKRGPLLDPVEAPAPVAARPSRIVPGRRGVQADTAS